MKHLPWVLIAILSITALVLWGKFSGAKSEVSDAQSKLSAAQGQIDSTQNQLSDVQQQARAAQLRAVSAQNQAASAEALVNSASLPEMHFRAGWPTPADGTDMRNFVTIYNDEQSDDTVTFVVTRSGGTRAEQDNVLIPKVGSVNLTIPDWTFIPGDTLTMSEIGHKDGQFIVPPT